ncbi:MAG: cell division protein ZapE [Gammaproteobacteria bacterium]|nr:cell division protein ZapE [Gammaproteobacteria bacterium]MCP5425813.1 cell division protein ZapE [Gammaproteobacteria bacterium]MCP5458576.1 cell division protein ZapE [Gammaproteobacteria bacterium]
MLYERYKSDLQRPGFRHDLAQEAAIRELQRIHEELLTRQETPPPRKKSGLLARLRGPVEISPAPPVRGLYLWGGVGRGKTYLVDTFFEVLTEERKKRLHFHRFMYQVHAILRELKEQQNPLRSVARQFAEQARIFCLDEFFVSDITDAMLLAGLLEALFAQGVTLVTTSNIPPDELYKDGLQRARFLPAIELLKRHLVVMHMDGGQDYRLLYLEKAEIYHYPGDEKADRLLYDTFLHVSPEIGKAGEVLEIEGRPIHTRRMADGVVWFDFTDICDGPRSQTDYLEIARCFHTVLISAVPVMDWQMENQARRFVNLVDVFYDHGVKLVLSAAAAPDALYRGERLKFEYQRTLSRLREMQSHDYLAREHLP